MLLGYCLDPTTMAWFPPISLTTPAECWHFCLRYHGHTPEIRITDLDDCLVLHVHHHILQIPLEAGQVGLIDLRDGIATVVPAATVQPSARRTPDPDGACEICQAQPWVQLAKWHEAFVCADCARTEARPDGA